MEANKSTFVSGKLPVAGPREVRAEATRLIKQHRGGLTRVVALYVGSAAAGLVGPFILGRVVDAVIAGTTSGFITAMSLLMLGFLVIQAVLRRFAVRAGMVFGETVFAELREDFMAQVTSLPLSTVEKAGTGDLVSRTTNDVTPYPIRCASVCRRLWSQLSQSSSRLPRQCSPHPCCPSPFWSGCRCCIR